jgi:hypothetical protein
MVPIFIHNGTESQRGISKDEKEWMVTHSFIQKLLVNTCAKFPENKTVYKLFTNPTA